MSTSTVDAKTRIGKGPWYNFKGDLIAQNVNDLLTADKNKISAKTSLTEKGTTPNYLAIGADGKAAPVAQPLQHDILTGTKDDGTKDENTCKDARTRGSLGTQRRAELLDGHPSVAGLRLGGARADRRRGLALLLRDQLMLLLIAAA